MSVLVLQQLDQHAREYPDATAYRMIGGGGVLTYGRLRQAVELLACEIRRVVPAGGVVVVGGENRLELPVALLGGLSAGVGVLAVSPLLAGDELRDLAERTGAAACIGVGHVLESLHGVVRHVMAMEGVLKESGAACFIAGKKPLIVTPHQADGTTAREGRLLLASSGTTARPKIVRRDAASLDVVARNCAAATGVARGEGVLGAIPLTHSYGVEHGLLTPVLAGACVCLSDGFDVVSVIGELVSGRVSVFPGVPFMFEAISQTDPEEMGFGSSGGIAAGAKPLGGVRCAYWAGGPLTVGILESLERVWGLRLGQLYGATEIGSVTFRPPDSCPPDNPPDNPPDDPPDGRPDNPPDGPLDGRAPDGCRPDCRTLDLEPPGGLPGKIHACETTNVGRAMGGVEIKIFEPGSVRGRVAVGPGQGKEVQTGLEGHVAVQAGSMFRGYVGEPDLGRGQAYFLTGDLGCVDGEGCLHLTGRIKLLIDVGGRKVNPLEVEGVLAGHPGVGGCVVVGVKASETVQRLKAVVVPRTAGGAGFIDSLRDYLRGRLAGYKVPRVIELVEDLPRLPSGKIDRRALGS